MVYWKAKNNTPLKKEMGPYKPFDVDDIIKGGESSEDKTEKKWESYYPLTEEQKNTPTEEEIDQKKIQQQIDGTYIETEEDAKKIREKWKNVTPNRPK